MALFLMGCVVLLSGCSKNGHLAESAPRLKISPSDYTCPDWPSAPIDKTTSQQHVAAWLEGEVKPAFDSCKAQLTLVGKLNQ